MMTAEPVLAQDFLGPEERVLLLSGRVLYKRVLTKALTKCSSVKEVWAAFDQLGANLSGSEVDEFVNLVADLRQDTNYLFVLADHRTRVSKTYWCPDKVWEWMYSPGDIVGVGDVVIYRR